MGEKVSDEAMGFFAISTIGRISGCVYWYLMGIEDLSKRSEVPLKAATDTTNLILPVSRASKEASDRDGQNDGYGYLLSVTDANILKEICIGKLGAQPAMENLTRVTGLPTYYFVGKDGAPMQKLRLVCQI